MIVPVYNAESYLRICLDSILQQSLEEIEILAVDDGSKDHSAKILREYEKKYPDKIHVIYQENQGQSAARNHALAMASGEFVAFVDSDDYIGKDFLKRMYNTAIEKKSDMVMCNYTKVTERGEIIQKYEINYQEKGIRIPSYLCCNRLVRRQLFDTWKIYFREGVICEDIPLILKLEALPQIFRPSGTENIITVQILSRQHLRSKTGNWRCGSCLLENCGMPLHSVKTKSIRWIH